MKWHHLNDGRIAIVECTSSANTHDEATPHLGEFWIELLRRVESDCQDRDVVCVVVELWVDKGLLIGHLEEKKSKGRKWPFEVRLGIPYVRALTKLLPDKSDPEFMFRMAQLQTGVWIALNDAAQISTVFEFGQTVQQSFDLVMFRQIGDDPDTRVPEYGLLSKTHEDD